MSQHSILNDIVPALTEDGDQFKPYIARSLKNKFVVFLFECIPLDKVYVGMSQCWQPAPHRTVLELLKNQNHTRYKSKQDVLGSLVNDFQRFGSNSFSCTVLSGTFSKTEARDTKNWLTSSIIPNEFLYNCNKRGHEDLWQL